jgi:PIN domain nuclease of toxin-antitoxin system
LILIDTHIWIWWVQGSPRLTKDQVKVLEAAEESGIGVSAISLVEISRSAAIGGLELPVSTAEWFEFALAYPGVELLAITPAIATLAYSLPEPFHKDPSDRIIVATALELDLPLMTADLKVSQYPHVRQARR